MPNGRPMASAFPSSHSPDYVVGRNSPKFAKKDLKVLFS
jgi:hypothetical protein